MQAEEHKTRRRRKGTERVKAWIYSVLNPLMEDLRAENKLLSQKNITWRYQTTEMEFIRKTRELISPLARPNYDDLLRGRPDLQPKMDGRDARVEMLTQAALECWKDLTQDSWFEPQVKLNLQLWIDEGNAYPGGTVPREEFWLLIAEYLMNNTQVLPYHYTSQPFWYRFRAIFLTFRGLRTPFSKLEKTIVELEKTNGTLIELIDRVRSDLCDEYDIPAAPIN